MRQVIYLLILCMFALSGCSTTGNLGIVTKSTADPSSLLTTNTTFKELGPAEGQSCRHFILAIIPFGESDTSSAVDKALEKTGGDALINVSTESSLYGFIPYFNVYSFTCTTVRGTAVKFESVAHTKLGDQG
ncbi:MAG: hypothetical protein MRJ96_09375 [Nitrospirales bacterium]|nr:hypothetical protein [Nitrospira sp.]MDR4501644.1 hypothetical protein [Nitrospirales bacterium]